MQQTTSDYHDDDKHVDEKSWRIYDVNLPEEQHEPLKEWPEVIMASDGGHGLEVDITEHLTSTM